MSANKTFNKKSAYSYRSEAKGTYIAHDQVVHSTTQCPVIHSSVIRRLLQHLGGHILSSARAIGGVRVGTGDRLIADESRPEVGYPDVVERIYQDVLWLDVSVDYAHLVNGSNSDGLQ